MAGWICFCGEMKRPEDHLYLQVNRNMKSDRRCASFISSWKESIGMPPKLPWWLRVPERLFINLVEK